MKSSELLKHYGPKLLVLTLALLNACSSPEEAEPKICSDIELLRNTPITTPKPSVGFEAAITRVPETDLQLPNCAVIDVATITTANGNYATITLLPPLSDGKKQPPPPNLTELIQHDNPRQGFSEEEQNDQSNPPYMDTQFINQLLQNVSGLPTTIDINGQPRPVLLKPQPNQIIVPLKDGSTTEIAWNTNINYLTRPLNTQELVDRLSSLYSATQSENLEFKYFNSTQVGLADGLSQETLAWLVDNLPTPTMTPTTIPTSLPTYTAMPTASVEYTTSPQALTDRFQITETDSPSVSEVFATLTNPESSGLDVYRITGGGPLETQLQAELDKEIPDAKAIKEIVDDLQSQADWRIFHIITHIYVYTFGDYVIEADIEPSHAQTTYSDLELVEYGSGYLSFARDSQNGDLMYFFLGANNLDSVHLSAPNNPIATDSLNNLMSWSLRQQRQWDSQAHDPTNPATAYLLPSGFTNAYNQLVRETGRIPQYLKAMCNTNPTSTVKLYDEFGVLKASEVNFPNCVRVRPTALWHDQLIAPVEQYSADTTFPNYLDQPTVDEVNNLLTQVFGSANTAFMVGFNPNQLAVLDYDHFNGDSNLNLLPTVTVTPPANK